MTSFLVDLGMEIEDAVHHPRINVDGGPKAEVDPRLGPEVLEQIAKRLPTAPVEALVTPNHYGNPVLAGIDRGSCFGAPQTSSPVAAALGREES